MRPRKGLKKFTKFDSFKPRLDLLPPWAIEIVGYCLRHGAVKYAPNNWAKCKDPSRYIAAMLRHIMSHQKGEFTDLESGIPHIAAAVTSGLFALDLYARGVQDKTMLGVYFAIVKRASKRSGLIIKRFRSFEPAWSWLIAQGLDPEKYLVKSVPLNEKTGDRTVLNG